MNTKEMDGPSGILGQLTLEEKASLCSGKDFWTLKGIERLGLPSIMVTDGPHGLRKQAGGSDHLGINQSVPAACFPAASAGACSFDRELLREIGAAMGEECLQERVAVILGPGANIKRSPLCGRNFEYFSEDPYLSGEMAAALINGVQSKGVGTSLKHYAANNQETRRMTSNSVVDERALREIYLAGFERAVKKSQPWTVMCSYNLINGVYASDNERLLSGILRDEWGFKGLVMTDWGAVDDRVQGIRAGLDLEMPGSGGINDAKIVEAVKSGALDEKLLDRVVLRIVELILKSREQAKPGYAYNAAAHHQLARRAAAESAVLLKNEGDILPLCGGTAAAPAHAGGKTLAVIGAFAEKPRYQGAGSSKINPFKLENPLEELRKAGLSVEYAPGYKLDSSGGTPDTRLIAEAAALAGKKDIAVVFAGLPDEYESEGFDRNSLDMPPSHNELIEAVAAANPNTIVVLFLGAPVILPWADRVKGILLLYLGGQAVGGAAADLLTGLRDPAGRLAETWPLSLEDNPSYHYFPGGSKSVEYRESVFVGYRYYNTVDKPVAYPFGYGLSYTAFEYSDLTLSRGEFRAGEELQLRVTVKNTGNRSGAEVVQVYVAPESSQIFRPCAELKGFEKIRLEAGESKTVTITLDDRSFAYYHPLDRVWALEGGSYSILVGANSRDIRLRHSVTVAGDGREAGLAALKDKAPEYFGLTAQRKEAPAKDGLVIPPASFEAVYGRGLPPAERLPGEPFTLNSTIQDIKDTPAGQALLQQIVSGVENTFGAGNEDMRPMIDRMIMEMPLRTLNMMTPGGMPPGALEGILAALNSGGSANSQEFPRKG
ncbi:MAG: glycoside hydrolase family 3 C-terminal domain-containing protein [Treponema sp.]|jgi:beta-glucosidase|nr:glycoside hydrolase family 3 C-terminal domain-containing protein [Treponema sp.]